MIDLRRVKAEAMGSLPIENPGRALILAQPDHIEERTLDALVPSLVRLVRSRDV